MTTGDNEVNVNLQGSFLFHWFLRFYEELKKHSRQRYPTSLVSIQGSLKACFKLRATAVLLKLSRLKLDCSMTLARHGFRC